MGLQLDSLHQLVLVRDVLRERHIEHRPGRPVQPPAGKLRVAHDANDAERAGVLREIEAEALGQGILARLEEALHEGLVHDRHKLGGLVVGLAERASPEEGHTEVLEIAGAHAVPGGAAFFAHFRRGMARHVNHFAPVVGQRVVERQTRSPYARQAIEAFFELAVHRCELRLRVRRRRRVQRDDDPSLHLVTEVLPLEVAEAARQHRRAGDQHDRHGRLHDQQRLASKRPVIARAATGAAQDGHRVGSASRTMPGRRRTRRP